MNKVNVQIKISTDKLNNKLSRYTISKYDGYSIIEIETVNNYQGDDETLVNNIYHHLIQLDFDVYCNDINILWNDFKY
ncbi:hypothetical protein [Pragia fontium]|uniref:hypothetical protein n=1 Tax=Pragia fontium TaxID=82985 RepID=UPI000F6E9362|nr:hypothetical protein [Pragia fontium]VEJ53817.1 Uncharacterised protein [Pragia fontium]